MAELRLRNLISITAKVQAGLGLLAERRGVAGDAAAVAGLAGRTAREVEAIAGRAGLPLASLPMPSQRAYQWLAFLSEPENLASAAAALALTREVLVRATWPRRKAIVGCPVVIEFYPSASLYRMRPESRRPGATLRVTIGVGYLYAPPDVLEAVLRAALGHGRAARARLHAYSLGDDFSETTQALELATEPPPGGLRGAHYDLERVFETVNAVYFSGGLARPRLTWSGSVARRRLGYYQPSADRLVISRALDAAAVPACAIELVMYHELLHKHLGVQVVNGRQAAHTERFREAERRFREFAAAEAFLKGL
jgi:hypothetical protein